MHHYQHFNISSIYTKEPNYKDPWATYTDCNTNHHTFQRKKQEIKLQVQKSQADTQLLNLY